MNISDFNPRRILIIQTAFLGDVILTLPLLRKVKSLFPNAAVDFLAIPAARNILETIPEIKNLWIYDKHQKEKGMVNLIKYIRRLRSYRYDLGLVPHRSIRSALLAWGSNIPLRIGFDSSSGHFLFNKLMEYPKNVHEINRNLHLLAPFGVNVKENVFPELDFDDEDRQKINRWFSERELISNNTIITMAPGSVWPTKRWLSEHFAILADMLVNQGYQIILIGSENDKAVARQIRDLSRANLHDATGEFTLRQSALLISKSQLLVTNDSAPLHLGVAVNTPVVAIFGPTVPAFGFYPYGANDRVVELKGLKCRPCGKHGGYKCPIGTFECMKMLTPQRVFDEVQKCLTATQSDSTVKHEKKISS